MYVRANLITNVSEQFWMSKFRFSVPKLVEIDPHIAYIKNAAYIEMRLVWHASYIQNATCIEKPRTPNVVLFRRY